MRNNKPLEASVLTEPGFIPLRTKIATDYLPSPTSYMVEPTRSKVEDGEGYVRGTAASGNDLSSCTSSKISVTLTVTTQQTTTQCRSASAQVPKAP